LLEEAQYTNEGNTCEMHRLFKWSVKGSTALSRSSMRTMELPHGSETGKGHPTGRPFITMDEEVKDIGGEQDAKVPQRLVGITDIAQYVGLSKHTVYTMVSQRRIPFVKIGRLTRFDLRSVDSWIKQHSVHPRRHTRNGA
jgi:excisionase family DNA binding protein